MTEVKEKIVDLKGGEEIPKEVIEPEEEPKDKKEEKRWYEYPIAFWPYLPF